MERCVERYIVERHIDVSETEKWPAMARSPAASVRVPLGLSIRRKVIEFASQSQSSGRCRLWSEDYGAPQPVKRAIHNRLQREQSPLPNSMEWRRDQIA